MSPEQVAAQPVTGASDQYSLGVVAYEMLTGQAAVPRRRLMSMMYAHVHTPPEPLIETCDPTAPRACARR